VFISAEKLYRMRSGRGMHAIYYGWRDFSPRFLLFSEGTGIVEQFLETISISVLEERICVGSMAGGVYTPCPAKRAVEYSDQCRQCSRSIIPVQRCLFEPICDGSICNWELCKRDHMVYVAFHGGSVKVGMTSTKRLRERLIEQGADAFSVVGNFPNRLAARNAEREISREMHIPQFHRSEELLLELWKGPDWRQIERIHAKMADNLLSKFGLEMGELLRLEDYPIQYPLEEKPSAVPPVHVHDGRVSGVKGKFLIYRGEKLSALNMDDLVSHNVILF